jgi:hypothetical protein
LGSQCYLVFIVRQGFPEAGIFADAFRLTRRMRLGVYLSFACSLTVLGTPAATPAENRDPLFSAVQRLPIELPPEGVEILQQYQQV